jgi:hypothetical protein
MGTGGSFPGGKAAGGEANHSPATSADVKKMRICTSTLTYVFMVYRDNFTFILPEIESGHLAVARCYTDSAIPAKLNALFTLQ